MSTINSILYITGYNVENDLWTLFRVFKSFFSYKFFPFG